MFILLQCRSCGNILIAKAGQKTKLCTYCNTRLQVVQAKILAEASDSREASRIAMVLKERLKS